MLRRIASAISLNTIDAEAETYRDTLEADSDIDGATWNGGAQRIRLDGEDDAGVSETALCIRCQAFDVRSFARSASRRKGYLLRDVSAGAQSGCTFCTLLLDAVQDVERPEYFYTHAFRPGKTVTKPDLYVHMTVSESYGEETVCARAAGLRANRLLVELGDRFSGITNRSVHEICLAADAGSAAARSGDILGRYIGDDAASDSHFDTARSWIAACESHAKCNETVSGSIKIDAYCSPLPTRVIEVVRESGQQRLYLRQTAGLHGAYMTLTHRWNEQTGQCITTTSNYEQRLLGGDFGPLPQLFLDAFHVAEKLNVKYIWIDSICIIQQGDDLADWRREAPNMAQYYQFSLFTLAGTADDMSGGLMHSYSADATPWASQIARLPYRDKLGVNSGYFYAYKRRVVLVDEYMAQVRSSILFRRGWILQEWLLSKRILWYTAQGLFYECQEELPRSYDQAQLTYGRASSELRAHLQLKASFRRSNEDILAFWYHALEVYSGQHLTKPDLDRILAVAGLAKEVGPILMNQEMLRGGKNGEEEEVYIAGLWLSDIHHGLLWERNHAALLSPIDKVMGAPSWSWASLMTPVHWREKLPGTKPDLKITGICLDQKDRHQVPDYLVHDHRHLRAARSNIALPQFDPANMSACLHIRAKIHVVHVRGYLESEDNVKRAALSTAYTPVPKTCNWRAICSAFRPEVIAGWGSLEQMDAHPTACGDYGVAVFALVVSTRWLRHGLWLKNSEPVLDVLYVEEDEGRPGVFRRLGVGRIGDRELIAEFEHVEERDVQLV